MTLIYVSRASGGSLGWLAARIILISSVISVAVRSGRPRIPAVQDGAEYARSVPGKMLDRKARAFRGCLAGAHDQNYSVRQAAKHAGICQVDHWRRINHDHVKLTAQARQ